jgi:hypothetical protein
MFPYDQALFGVLRMLAAMTGLRRDDGFREAGQGRMNGRIIAGPAQVNNFF